LFTVLKVTNVWCSDEVKAYSFVRISHSKAP
jgi:hypothetical protein